MANWSITYRELAIGFAVHGVIEIRDGNGNVTRSFEGLATSSSGNVKPLGTQTAGDTIRGYYERGASANAQSTPIIIFEGSREDVAAREYGMERATDLINSKSIPYQLPGVDSGGNAPTNSNSYIGTLFEVLGLDRPPPQYGTLFGQIGDGVLLLSQSEINNIRNQISQQDFSPGVDPGDGLPSGTYLIDASYQDGRITEGKVLDATTHQVKGNTVFNADGSLVATEYSSTGQKDLVTYKDGFGTVTKTQDYTPDGSHVDQVRGSDGVYDSFTYDNLSRLTQSDDGAANGSHVYTTYDVANGASWTSHAEAYDAGGHLLSNSVNNDDGSHVLGQWDAYGQQTWSAHSTTYDAGWHPLSETFTNDNGSYIANQWDQAGQQPWYYVTTSYGPGGNALSQTFSNDDGTSAVNQWDYAASQPWWQATTNYGSARAPTSQLFRNDNGSYGENQWDQADDQSWWFVTTNYDWAWNPSSQTFTNDDGSVTINNWDNQGNQSWSYYRDPRDRRHGGPARLAENSFTTGAVFDLSGGGRRLREHVTAELSVPRCIWTT